MKGVLLAGIALLLGLLVAWLVRPEEERRGPRSAPPTGAEGQEVNPLVLQPPRVMPERTKSEEVVTTEPEPAPVAAAPKSVDRSPPSSVPAPGSASVRGTVIVEDAERPLSRTEDGGLTLLVEHAGQRHEQRVPVVGGRWLAFVPAEGDVRVALLAGSLGERLALGDEIFRPIPDDGWLELRARWPAPTLLHVTDEAGHELEDVRLLQIEGWPGSLAQHPGRAAAEARLVGSSPFVIPPDERCASVKRTLFAISPGRAWSHVSVDLRQGREAKLVLPAGGEVELELMGCYGSFPINLTMSGPSGRCELELASQRITGLVPGYHEFEARARDPSDDLSIRGRKVGVVKAAEALPLTLRLRTDITAEVQLSGRVVVPPEWELDSFELQVEGLDRRGDMGPFELMWFLDSRDMTVTDARRGEYRWSIPAAPAGTYSVSLKELTCSAVFSVCPGSSEVAPLIAPPPSELVVRCLDARTRDTVTGIRVHWNLQRDVLVGGFQQPAAWDESARAYRARVPQGSVTVDTDYGRGWNPVERTIETRAGKNEVTLELEPACSLRVVLREAGADGSALPAGRMKLVPLEGQGGYECTTRELGASVLHRPSPGRYTLQITPPDGYAPVPDVEVRLEQGRVLEHVVELALGP